MNDNVALPSEFPQSPKFDRQVVPLAANFAGLNRITSPQNLDASQSPDTTDARSSNLRMGALGPRNGRYSIWQRTTDPLSANTSSRPYLPFVGLGVLNSSYGKYRVLADAGGSWVSSIIAWPGLNAVTVPTTLTGRANARTRFTQYKNRLYGYNGRDRMRDLDGTDWQFAGITRPLSGGVAFAPTFAISALQSTITILSASASGGVATITTQSAHGLNVGDTVQINVGDPQFNGVWVIVTVPTSTTFTYALAANTGATPSNVSTIVAMECTGRIATVTFAANHTFNEGDIVTIASSNSAFNGTFYADIYFGYANAALSAKQISFILPYGTGDLASFVATGTATAQTNIGPGLIYTTAAPFWQGSNINVSIIIGSTWSITSNVATVVTASAHGLKAGQKIYIGQLGAAVSGGNSDGPCWQVLTVASVTNSTTFTAAITMANIAFQNRTFTVLGYLNGTATKIVGPTGTYRYFFAASNNKHGDAWGRAIESIPTLISAEANTANQTVTINNIPATHPDPQVDTWNVYRNKTGEYSTDLTSDQQDFWLVGTVAIGTTTFTDTKQDYQLTGADRLRFDQNIPPAFKYAQIYGDRMFGAGFDPITDRTAIASGATITLSSAVPDGVLGCWFKADGDDAQYNIIAQPTDTTLTLDRVYNGTLASDPCSIYRNPWEIWFSEFQDVEAWGPDGEQLRYKMEVPGHQAVTGLMEWNGSLLVFTVNAIYAISGKGPNRTDVRLLPAPLYNGLGAVSGDAICKVDNDVYFLSMRGPAAMASGVPQLIGINLNYDYIDRCASTDLALACMGTDGRDVYVSLTADYQQTENSKTFRYELYTKTWWEETGMCPVMFIRANWDDGEADILTYLQGENVMRLNFNDSPQIDGNNPNQQPVWYDNPTIVTSGPVQYIAQCAFNDFTLIETVLRFYAKNTLVGIRRIVANVSDTYFTDNTKMIWSLDHSLPYAGDIRNEPMGNHVDRIEWGAINWRWVSKTLEVNGKLSQMERCLATFDTPKGHDGTVYKTDIVDGAVATNAHKIQARLKTEAWPIRAANFDYAVVLTSRDNAVIRHVECEIEAEASNK